MGRKCQKNTIALYEIIEITVDTSQIELNKLILSISNPFKFLRQIIIQVEIKILIVVFFEPG